MSEEIINEAVEIAEVTTPEVAEIQQELPKGYMSKEDFVAAGNDAKDYVTPQEYERRGQYFDHIKDLKKQMEAVVGQNQLLVRKVNEAEMRGYHNAIRELELRRNVAVEELDTRAVKELDQQIGQYQQLAEKERMSTIPREALAFKEKHEAAFMANPSKFMEACKTEELIRIKNPSISPGELFQRIEEEVFGTPTRAKPIAPVMGSARSTAAGKTSITVHDLSDTAQQAFKAIRSVDKSMTLEKYVESAKRCGITEGLYK